MVAWTWTNSRLGTTNSRRRRKLSVLKSFFVWSTPTAADSSTYPVGARLKAHAHMCTRYSLLCLIIPRLLLLFRSELKELLERLEIPATETEVAALFQTLDVDGNGEVSYEVRLLTT